MRYTEEQIEWLRKNVPNMTFKEATEEFNKTFNTNKKYRGLKVYCNQYLKIYAHPTKGYISMANSHKLPIGSERIDKDGYVAIKVKDEYKKHSYNWVHKHRLIYEQHYGPIPKDMYVIFLDGNKRNFDINNIQLANRKTLLLAGRYCGHHPHITKAAIAVYDTYLNLRRINNETKR